MSDPERKAETPDPLPKGRPDKHWWQILTGSGELGYMHKSRVRFATR